MNIYSCGAKEDDLRQVYEYRIDPEIVSYTSVGFQWARSATTVS